MVTDPHIALRTGQRARREPSARLLRRARGVVALAVVALLALVYVIPLGWVISTSLRTSVNLFDPTQWIPSPATLDHYATLFQVLPTINTYLFNTARIAVLSTIGQLLSCSMAGYALARLRFPGRNVLLFILLITLMIPGQATLIPIYVLFRTLGWINTPLPFIVPAFFGNAFATFFFRQFFLTLPRELEEAATIDGANRWRIYRGIIVPLSTPAFLAIGLLTFVNGWNNYFLPSVFLQTSDQWVLTQGLLSLVGQYNSQWGEIMAGVVLMSLPMVLLYLVVQRYLVQGIAFVGIIG